MEYERYISLTFFVCWSGEKRDKLRIRVRSSTISDEYHKTRDRHKHLNSRKISSPRHCAQPLNWRDPWTAPTKKLQPRKIRARKIRLRLTYEIPFPPYPTVRATCHPPARPPQCKRRIPHDVYPTSRFVAPPYRRWQSSHVGGGGGVNGDGNTFAWAQQSLSPPVEMGIEMGSLFAVHKNNGQGETRKRMEWATPLI